ncbi:MAG: hypothetical protein AAF634_18215 [Bacteroidota bacterium]
MKTNQILFLLVLIVTACKTDKKEENVIPPTSQDIAEKIAAAHGYSNWKDVKEIGFTFNVDRDSTHFERSWVWQTKSNRVTYISGTDTLSYDRKNMDSIAYKTNAGFINDRYWLLAPFNLMWDKDNYKADYAADTEAPISKSNLQKLTIVYNSEGGYTPGDAYDFYFGDDYLLREWVFRKGNQPEPSTATTWENYLDTLGIKLGRDHKKGDEVFNLYLDGIIIKK